MSDWDFFISHAGEDKEEVARPLAAELTKVGFRVWFDSMSLTLGDSLSRSIDRGIAHSRYGIVILSQTFFAKQWPRRELDSLASLEVTNGEKKILPVWHGIDQSTISRFSPALGDKVGVSTANGLKTVVAEVRRAFSVGYREDVPEIRVIDRVLKPLLEELSENPENVSLRYVQGESVLIIEATFAGIADLGQSLVNKAALLGRSGRYWAQLV
jgi:hypothetical protein